MKMPELLPASQASTSNLAIALLWLPRPRRTDAMLFYRFCRTIDDIADEPGRSVQEKQDRLAAWLETVESGLHPEIERLLARYAIDRSLLAAIVCGCASDILPQRFQTLADLEKYCWRVACAVGLASIKIFGCRDPLSESYAVHLGHALQLTNILRDVGEDAQQGRIYLPLADLARFGVSEETLLARQPGPAFLPLMRYEAARARARFAAAVAPVADFQALRAARIMRSLYETILTRLERDHFPVLATPLKLKPHEKLFAILQASLASPQRENFF